MIKLTDRFCCILNRQWLKGPSIFVTFHEHLLGLLPNQARIPLIQNINRRTLKRILNNDVLLFCKELLFEKKLFNKYCENTKFGCYIHV